MNEPAKPEGLTPLEIELLDALEHAAAYIRDLMGEHGEQFRQKRLQPVINKATNVREAERLRIWRSVK